MNEFVARNGLIALDSSSISGPFVVTGSVSINSGGLTVSAPSFYNTTFRNAGQSVYNTYEPTGYNSWIVGVETDYFAVYSGRNVFYLHRDRNNGNSYLNSNYFRFGAADTATAQVDIAGSSTARASLRIRSGSAPTTPNDGDIWISGSILYLKSGLETSGSLTVTGSVNVSGKIGVNNTNPIGRLDVIGSGGVDDAAIKSWYNNYSVLGEVSTIANRNGIWNTLYIFETGSSATNAILVEGNKPIIFKAGNVGIGTTTPADNLDVSGFSVFGTTTERVSIGGTALGFNRKVQTGSIYDSRWFAYQFTHTPNSTNTSDYLALQVYSGSSTLITGNALAINGAGNVGIGTTSISYRLQVAGTIYADRIFVPNAIGDYGLMVGTTSRYSYTPLTVDGSNWSALATGVFQHNRSSTTYTGGYDQPLLSLSNYNTSANTWNIIEFGKRADTAEAIAAIGVQYKDASNSDMAFFTEGGGAFNEKVRLLANGNFGIGTNSAAFKLDVSGSLRTTSTAIITGSLIATGKVESNEVLLGSNENIDKIYIGALGAATYGIRGFQYSGTLTIAAGYLFTGGKIVLYGQTAGSGLANGILMNSRVGINTNPTTYALDTAGSFRAYGAITATSGSDYFDISHDITQPAQTGSQVYEVNITPTLRYTAPNQTQTALRVAATFSGSAALSSSQSNIIADFGSTSAGSQFLVNDVTSGSIYMVNDVSGLPIIEANSNWDVLIYDYPNVILRKTGSTIDISGSLRLNGSSLDTGWTAYTPVWTATSTNPVIGNGTITGAYKIIGKTCFVRVKLVIGTTTTTGTGPWEFSLPVSASTSDGIQFPCSMLDNGFAWYQGIINGTYTGATGKSSIIAQSPGGFNSSEAVTAVHPFTWGSTDSLMFNGSYETV
jgi:hypothetical protein